MSRRQRKPVDYSLRLNGDRLFPASAIRRGLLTQGQKAFRVLVQLDARGRLMPTALVVNNVTANVVPFPTANLGQLARGMANQEHAKVLRGWAAQYRAEQAGLEGRA